MEVSGDNRHPEVPFNMSNTKLRKYTKCPFTSKSRSVDHGLAAPYDLDSLRSKVEGRFGSVERLSKELIPRPARPCADPPLHSRLRMGRPIGKAMPLPTAVMSYGKKKLKTEFIFSIQKNLYRFLNTWVPNLCGELDEEQITASGFELIQHDTEWVKGGQSKDGRTM